ncbi:uncharacterized protein [Palaemon carinicauda]|uniref:uncharacterized protein n=1 Tax=Palaemon carinicauda TaxID=392227 RepID=UPI0035B69DBE
METAIFARCTSALLTGWMATFGMPEYITSDWSTTLTSKLWISLVNLLGITLQQTTTYIPTPNKMVECFHHTLKAALMSRCNDPNWITQLSWVPELRTTPKDTLDVSTTEIVVLAEFFLSTTSSNNLQLLRHVVEKINSMPPDLQANGKAAHTNRYKASHVFLRNDTRKPVLTPPYRGHFVMIH